MADDNTPDNNAPGDSFVTRAETIAIAAYLLLLMLLLFFLIGWLWPTCEDTSRCPASETQNQNRAVDSNNSNGAAPGPAANTDSNANSNANTNTNTNTNTSTDTTTNTSETAPPGPTRTPATPAPNPARSPTTPPASGAGQTATGIDIDTVTPVSGSVCGGTQVTIKGKNFPATKPIVEFGGASAFVNTHSADTISANSPAHPAGTVDVVVRPSDGGPGDKILLAFSYTCPSPSGGTLLWLVILAGALGGTIHALRSFYWYVGNRELKRSWVLMYVFLPFTGAAIALIFYLIIVAGLLPSSTGKDVPLYVIAVGALAGMFSTQAALKLTDLGNAIFVKPEQGKDAKPQRGVPPGGGGATPPPAGGPSIEPSSGPAGQRVEIKGTGFTDVDSVTFGGKPSDPAATFDAPIIRATAPTRDQGPGEVDVVVTNKAGKTVTLKYTYTA